MSEAIDANDKNDKNKIVDTSTYKKSDFVEMFFSLLKKVNIKVAVFLFFIGMIIFSDLFMNNVLTKFSDSLYGECTTTKGTIIQLLLFVLAYLTLDLLSAGGLV